MPERETYLHTRATAAGRKRPVGQSDIGGRPETTGAPLSDEQECVAVRYVAGGARDAADALELLQHLGIDERDTLRNARALGKPA